MQIYADFHTHLGKSRDGGECSLKTLLSHLTRYKIRRAVVFPIDEPRTGRSYDLLNSKIIRAVRSDRRLTGFMRLDPKAGIYALRELDRCVKAGLRGVKLHPRAEKFSPRQAEPVLREASRRKLPVILHTSHEPGCTPAEWHPLLRKYRGSAYILAHAGKDRYLEAGKIARREPHVYLDTTTLSSYRTARLIKVAGAAKILFASDVPYSHPEVETAKFRVCGASRESLTRIFRANGRLFFEKYLRPGS